MPVHIRCADCETTLLGIHLTDEQPTPISRDECPVCGSTEFDVRE